jgi:hypothetical protein
METITHPLTDPALLLFVRNMVPWISTLAPFLASIAPPYKLHVPRRDIEKFQEISVSENHGIPHALYSR